MGNPNSGKVKWVILVGLPDMLDPYWKSIEPSTGDMTPCWFGQTVCNGSISDLPKIYDTKYDAEKIMTKLKDKKSSHTSIYTLSIQKYNPRKSHP